MRSSHRVPLTRVAAVLSTLGVAGAIACSDSATTVRPADVGSAAFDKGGSGNSGKGNQNNEGKGNEGKGNQNNPKDTLKNNPKDTVKNNNQRVKLEARLMTVAGDTTFRGAEGKAEFESRTTEMKFKISVEHIAVGTAVSAKTADGHVIVSGTF